MERFLLPAERLKCFHCSSKSNRPLPLDVCSHVQQDSTGWKEHCLGAPVWSVSGTLDTARSATPMESAW